MTATRALPLLAVLTLVGLAGCAAFPYVGPTCGPGDTDIGTITGNASDLHLKGEVTHVNESLLVLDDGTGEAAVLLFDAGVSEQVSTGDCVIARNAVATAETDRSYDVVVLTGDLLREDIVVEDERR